MIDIQLDPTQQLPLIGCLILWACLLFGGFAFGNLNDANTRKMPTWTRMTSSFTLVVFAWLWWLFVQNTPDATIGFAFAIGMTFGWLGDLFMAQLLPVKEHVLGGIASFGMGHIAYIIGLLSAGNTFDLTDGTTQLLTWVIWLIIGFGLWYTIVYHKSDRTFLHKAALPYALLLASTTGVAMGLALQHPAFIPITIGAGLFLLSDLILATELFNGANWRYIGDVVWLTYGPGQMLIVSGLALPVLISLS